MWTLAKIAFEPYEELGGIHARGKSEIFAAQLAEPARVAKIQSLADGCARNLHFDVHLVLRYPHVPFSLSIN
jgi:hypothetical protein